MVCRVGLCRAYTGMQVTEGSGRMLVMAVGGQSEWGRTMALVATEAQPTPLQVLLAALQQYTHAFHAVLKHGIMASVAASSILLHKASSTQHALLSRLLCLSMLRSAGYHAFTSAACG